MHEKPKRCFVVMGFGIKTDYATGRKLDLNKSYRLLIKPVVEERGLQCIRADEIRHSGSIDMPMYQELLKADVVVADLSTANVNAFYELGVRHALRPYTTVVISEDKLAYPFDLNHIKITNYTHLGDAIDYEEVERFRKELGRTLDAVLNNKQLDSPVYTYLDGLIPPALKEQIEEAVEKKNKESDEKEKARPAGRPKRQLNQTLSLITDQGEEALKNKEFSKAKGLFSSALLIGKSEADSGVVNDSYLIHRLALATYKAKQPDNITALKEAINLLDQLDLAHTNDSETVVLAGKIEKRLYFNGQGEQHLLDAIQYYERAYFLLHNRYNGINLAFLINNRSETAAFSKQQDIIADLILANRIRQEVVSMCDREWTRLQEKQAAAKDAMASISNELAASQQAMENEQRFWILVNRAEACFGLGEMEKFRTAKREAAGISHQPWMMTAFEEQIKKLRVLLKKHGGLLNPAWKED